MIVERASPRWWNRVYSSQT